jgi:dihydropyrimidinase
MSLLIKNGRIITAADDYSGDVFIEGEKIVAVGRNLDALAARPGGAGEARAGTDIIDATGLLVLPGGIDPHVHLDMPFMGTFSSDTHETGTRAALFGGTTTVIDFVLQTQGHSLREALEQWNGRARGTAVGDYSFHIAVTDFNDQTRAEIRTMIETEGITSFKTFMAYKGALMIDDRQMTALMQ